MPVRGKEQGIASGRNFAFLVRRARLILGETQGEFAGHFDVETSTVSRWERGLVKPMPKALAKITKIASQTDPHRTDDIIKASPVFKYLADIADLTEPLIVSKGFASFLEATGYTFDDFLKHQTTGVWARPNEPNYEHTIGRCLRQIQEDPRWVRGEIAYVEFRGLVKASNNWARGLVAPLPGKGSVALFEAVVDRDQSAGRSVTFAPAPKPLPLKGD